MNNKPNDHFKLKLLSLAVLAGFSVAAPEIWSEGLEESADCQQIEPANLPVLPKALGDELEIVSWNIQKTSNLKWRQDLNMLSTSASLVFIQEAVLQADIADSIPENLHREFAPGYRRGKLQTGVMTFSASSPTLACDLSINEPWLRTPKATSIVQYRLTGRDENLLVVNLHAVNFTLGLKSYRKQFSALDEYLEEHPGPVILAGDLNTWSNKRQQWVNDFMVRHGMSSISFEPDYRSKVFGKALDHIYVRGLKAQSAETIRVDSSDHNPLKVRLRLI